MVHRNNNSFQIRRSRPPTYGGPAPLLGHETDTAIRSHTTNFQPRTPLLPSINLRKSRYCSVVYTAGEKTQELCVEGKPNRNPIQDCRQPTRELNMYNAGKNYKDPKYFLYTEKTMEKDKSFLDRYELVKWNNMNHVFSSLWRIVCNLNIWFSTDTLV